MRAFVKPSAVSFAALCFLVPSLAEAASGTLTGTWYFYQNQGNYCDTPDGTTGDQNNSGNQTCTSGATRYPESQFHTWQTIGNSKIYVKDQNDVVIGTGATNGSGYFSIVWTRSTTPTHVRLFWQLENKDNRFRVRGDGGGTYAYWSWEIDVINGATTNVGGLYVGSAADPSGIANIYDGADRMWYDALNYSNNMKNNFTNLEIRAYPTDCPTACADGGANLIKMPTGAEFQMQGRILHEMGHIASYKANPRRTSHGSYCYPNQEWGTSSNPCPTAPSNAGWNLTSSEWRGVALEEGRATFFGDVALYWNSHADARTCISSGTCATSGRLETTASCTGTIGRRALQIDRYLWDIYDDAQDDETNREDYYEFFDTIGATPSGYDWGEKESPFQNSGNTVDAWDSYHPWEWHNSWLNQYSGQIETESSYFNNCMGWF